jgi:hypothetical protein
MSVRLNAALFTCSAGLLVASVLLVTPPGASGESPDNTPPTADVSPEFEVGGLITRRGGYVCGDDSGIEITQVPYRVRYSASDASGIRWFNRWFLDGDGYPDGPSDFWGDEVESPWRDVLTDYEGECGGGIPEPSGWAITAYDEAGNAKYVDSGPAQPDVYQQNGISLNEYAAQIPVSRTGTWSTSTCACASGGSQMSTRQLGATATYTVTGGAEGALVGLVMAQGPGRGSFQVRVNGSVVATLDSRAATNRNRVIVWQGRIGPGNHTVAVRNLATSGRPRIDVDAVLVYVPRDYVL